MHGRPTGRSGRGPASADRLDCASRTGPTGCTPSARRPGVRPGVRTPLSVPRPPPEIARCRYLACRFSRRPSHLPLPIVSCLNRGLPELMRQLSAISSQLSAIFEAPKTHPRHLNRTRERGCLVDPRRQNHRSPLSTDMTGATNSICCSTSSCRPPGVLFRVSRQSPAVSYQPSAISHQPSADSRQPSAVSRQPIADS